MLQSCRFIELLAGERKQHVHSRVGFRYQLAKTVECAMVGDRGDPGPLIEVRDVTQRAEVIGQAPERVAPSDLLVGQKLIDVV